MITDVAISKTEFVFFIKTKCVCECVWLCCWIFLSECSAKDTGSPNGLGVTALTSSLYHLASPLPEENASNARVSTRETLWSLQRLRVQRGTVGSRSRRPLCPDLPLPPSSSPPLHRRLPSASRGALQP